MSTATTQITACIADALRALGPEPQVQVHDDSTKHRGHPEAKRHGGGHYAITVVWPGFDGQPRLARHRLVHGALLPLFDSGLIHAVELTLRTPAEGTP
jgi:BolA protein